jgi:hypothetical protein
MVRHAKLNKDALKIKCGPHSSHTPSDLLTFLSYTQVDLTPQFIKPAVPICSRPSNDSCGSILKELVARSRTARLADLSPFLINNSRRIRA